MAEETPQMPALPADAHPVTQVFLETVWGHHAGREVHPRDLQTIMSTVDHRAKAVHGTSGDNAVGAERIAGEITGLFGFTLEKWGDSLTNLAKLCGDFHLQIRGLLFTTPAPKASGDSTNTGA